VHKSQSQSPSNGTSNGYTNGNGHNQGNGISYLMTNGNASEPEPRKIRFLLPFSAHDEQTLQANYVALAKSIITWDLVDVAFTLSSRRTFLSYRSFAITNGEEAQNGLPVEKVSATKKRASVTPTLGFVFTGQGAQWPRMGQALMKEYPSFLATIRRLDKYIDDLDEGVGRDWSIEEVLDKISEQSLKVYTAELSQPLVTALQIALVNLLRLWNVTPHAVVGHSSGEIAASYAAGLLTEEAAMIAAYLRGKAVLQNNKKGLMMAVGSTLSEIQPLVDKFYGQITIACHNSPESYTLSGDEDAMLKLKELLDKRKIFCRALATNNNAYHSHHMKSLGPQYENDLEVFMPKPTAVESLKQRSNIQTSKAVFFSSVYGHAAPWSLLGPKYWRQNLESPVLFTQAVTEMVTQVPLDILIEVGPHGALQGPLRQLSNMIDNDIKFPEYLTAIVRGNDNVKDILTLAGNLFNKGHDVDLARVNAIEDKTGDRSHFGKVIVDLPHYQWQYPKDIMLYENRYTREWRLRIHPRHDILGSRIPGANKNEPTWRNMLSVNNVPWLTDHRVSELYIWL
jgi:acyl transferase domain-containing protein